MFLHNEDVFSRTNKGMKPVKMSRTCFKNRSIIMKGKKGELSVTGRQKVHVESIFSISVRAKIEKPE